jgi:hypothetical protein
MRKALLSILAMGFISGKILSQCDYEGLKNNEPSVEIRGDIGRDFFNLNSRNLFSMVNVDSEVIGKNLFSELHVRIDEFSPNSYSNLSLGYNLINDKDIHFGPKISFTSEIDSKPHKDRYAFELGDKFGGGLNFSYKKFGVDILLARGKELSYLVNSVVDIKERRLELFTRGGRQMGNHSGIKINSKSFYEYFSIFGEYSMKTGRGIKYPRDFFNFGLTITGK